MSNAPQQPDQGGRSWLERLAPYRQEITYTLLVVAALIIIYPLVMLTRDGIAGATARPRFYLLIAFFLIAAAGAAFNATYQQLSEVEKIRVLLLALGGLVGFATFAFGLALPWTTYKDTFSGGVSKWRAEPAALVWTGLAVFGGLALMFASLQLARGVERSSGPLRRMLYGFNAVLGTLLLIAVLGLINVLAYVSVPPFSYARQAFDATGAGIYSLSPAMKNLLADLKQPVKVYVLMPRDSQVAQDVITLLENCRTVTNQLTWELASRDVNREKIRELQQRFALPETLGLLLVYGPGDKADFDFIKMDDLARRTSRPGEALTYRLTGEGALLKSLRYLSEGKTHPVVYFLQSEGELSLEAEGAGRGGEAISELRSRLEQGNYTVKPLNFDARTRSVPSDASVVVVARPTRTLSSDAQKALRDYMAGAGGKKGKLVVLLDVNAQGSQMVPSGLEALLGEFNVKVGNGHILTLLEGTNGTQIQAWANPNSNNPIAEAFVPSEGRSLFFRFNDARTVDAINNQPSGGVTYKVDKLLLVPWRIMLVWEETDLSKNPAALTEAMRNQLRRGENVDEIDKKLSRTNLCVAAAVSESKSDMPQIPNHPPVNQKEVPRLVVFGDAGWVSNAALNNEAANPFNYYLFASCLSWLRERPDIGVGDIEAKERKEYALNVPAGSVSRLEFLPLGLMALVVVGAGLGVWVVRRR
jgi:hypothetical protein